MSKHVFLQTCFFYVFFEKKNRPRIALKMSPSERAEKMDHLKKKFAPKPRSGADLWSILVFKKTCFKTCFRTCFWRILKLTINQPGIEISRRNFFLKWSIFYALSNGYNIIEIWGQLIFFRFFHRKHVFRTCFRKNTKIDHKSASDRGFGANFFFKMIHFLCSFRWWHFQSDSRSKNFFRKKRKKTCS